MVSLLAVAASPSIGRIRMSSFFVSLFRRTRYLGQPPCKEALGQVKSHHKVYNVSHDRSHSDIRNRAACDQSSPKNRLDTVGPPRAAGSSVRPRQGHREGAHELFNGRLPKTVTALFAAQKYDLVEVARLLTGTPIIVDSSISSVIPEVLRLSCHAETDRVAFHEDTRYIGAGEMFVFSSGVAVAWDVPYSQTREILRKIVPAAHDPQHEHMETEDLEYVEDPSTEKSSIYGDVILLGLKISRRREEELASHLRSYSSRDLKVPQLEALEAAQSVPNVTLAKIAFSSGLARSFVLRKTGELLIVRAQLNFLSELTDSIPDIFWDSRSALGLETYFEQVSSALDVRVRIKALNEKMDYASEIAAILREQLSERHGLLLEWLIIFLISVEVCFASVHLWTERSSRKDPKSTESMIRAYLEQQVSSAS